MPRFELDFLPPKEEDATDEQLLLQLVYGLCGQLRDPNEERSFFFVSAVRIPNPQIRRLAKLLVTKLSLPVPVERVDEWIKWHQTNQCWLVDQEMSEKAEKLTQLKE